MTAARPGSIWSWIIPSLMAGYVLSAYLLCASLGYAHLFNIEMYLVPYFAGYALIILPPAAYVLWRHRFGHPNFRILRLPDHLDFREFRHRLIYAMPILLAMPFFMAAFTSLKNLMGIVLPFSWDAELAAIDAGIHFGQDPWRLLPVGSPAFTWFIDIGYMTWVGLLPFAQAFIALRRPDDPNRNRFFLIYILSFVLLGNVAASLFMSAGPFYPGIDGAPLPRFQPLLDYLQSVATSPPLNAVFYQDFLLAARNTTPAEIGTGISAFPSLHVAIATLYFCFCLRFRRPWPWLAFGFLALVQIGSVHLAWHYAVDGYASILAVAVLWAGASYLIRDPQERAAPTPEPRDAIESK